MDADRKKQIGQTVGLNLYERKWTGTAIVVARRDELADVHAAVAERWRSLLAAMGSGSAHADQWEDTSALDAALASYKKVALIVAGAPGAPLPSSGERRVVFVAIEDLNALPDGVSVGYAVAPLSNEARLLFGNIAIVDMPAI